MKATIVLWIGVFLGNGVSAQFLSYQQLDTARVYKSLEEALKSPEDVFILRLKVKKGEIPKEVFDLPYLHVLELKKGKINTLPEDFVKLEHLLSLDLSANELGHFPKVLYEIPGLEILRLGKNPITRLPEDIVGMESLKLLDLWSTQVNRLPVVIEEMQNLREVDLRMIEISQEEQDYLQEAMPHVFFNFSVPCNCH